VLEILKAYYILKLFQQILG